MSEESTYTTEVEDALAMLGVGYDKNQPAALVEPGRQVLSLQDNGLEMYNAWGWVKLSAKFALHICKLSGANLKVWLILALLIDESGTCKLKIKQITQLTRLSHTEVINSTKELEEMGYLSVKRDPKGNEYKPIFTARGAGNEPDEVVKKVDSTLVDLVESTPPIEKLAPSISRVKRVKSTQNIKGIEAAMFMGRPVQEDDLPIGIEALQAFERDMQVPGNWSWYPAKTSDEKEWQEFREFVIKTYAADNQAFSKYRTWSAQPFSRGAMGIRSIKQRPADFQASWSDYLASSVIVKGENGPVQPAKRFPTIVNGRLVND